MVFDFLQKIRGGEKDLYVTCDNCSGQNKNNLSLWFWSWLIMLGWYENIYININTLYKKLYLLLLTTSYTFNIIKIKIN